MPDETWIIISGEVMLDNGLFFPTRKWPFSPDSEWPFSPDPNTHEAIIPMDEWQAVQAEFKRRRDLGPFGNKSLKLSVFSTKITCGCCGKHYRHSGKRNTAGEIY